MYSSILVDCKTLWSKKKMRAFTRPYLFILYIFSYFMNFLKNLLLFGALFAAGIVVLDVAWLVNVNIPWLSGNKNQVVVDTSTGVTEDTFVWTATVANLQNIPEPTCNEKEISTIEDGKVVCKIPQPARDLDCIDPSWLTVKQWDSIKLAKPELKKCTEAEFLCRDGAFVYQWTETTTSPSIVDYKYDIKECRPLVQNGIPCDAPWWSEKFDDGQLFIAYEKDIVTKDQDCKFEKVACFGGQLKQKFGYKYKTCAHAEDFSLEYIKQNSEKLVETNADGSISIAKTMTEDVTNTSKKSCTWFGRTILDGENIYAFKDQTVPFENDCEFEVKVCRDGTFGTPNKWYEFKECFIGKWADCTIWTTTLSHSNINTYYAKYDTTLKDCPSQVRRCWNGTPDGDEQYIYTTCNKPAARPTTTTPSVARCPNPYVGETAAVANGRQWVWYYANSVGRLGSCDGDNKVTVTCSNGTLLPISNSKKVWRSCTKGTPKDCTSSRGSIVPHGQSVVAFQSSSVTYGWVCQSEVRVCNDGNLDGSFTYQSCWVAQPASCVTPWWDTIPHNGSALAYQTDSVSYGSTCDSQSRVCKNGTLGWSFIYRSCTVNPPIDCTYNGTTIKHGQVIARYREPQVIGAVADGTDQCVRYTATCTNGSLQGTLMSHSEAVYLQCTTTIPNNWSNQ